MEVVPPAIEIFPRVDTFYVWGFPFETLEDFNQSLFQMISFRMMGGRILPSLLSLLPQTEVYRQCAAQYTLEFCPFLLPEFVFTGHEIADSGEMDIPERYQSYFRLIVDNPDIFPGFFHVDLKNNVMPKLEPAEAIRLLSRRPRQSARTTRRVQAVSTESLHSKAPSTKFQITNKRQRSNARHQTPSSNVGVPVGDSAVWRI